MTRAITVIAVLTMCAAGCSRPTTAAKEGEPTSKVSEPSGQPADTLTVVFDIKAIRDEAPAGAELYECRYEARGKTAKFRLELKQDGPLRGKEIPIASAAGRFISMPGSENSTLLEDLSTALEATHPVLTGPRVVELEFDAVVLGETQSRHPDGGFTSNPPGGWKLLKLFLPKGGDDGEVFLDVNPALGKGVFSVKGSDYGDYLVSQFARVL